MRPKKILWSPIAADDLKEAYEYIRRDSEIHSKALVRNIHSRVGKLARFEKLGRVIPELGQSRYRELIVGEYRVFHEIREQEILIFRVLHSKRFFQ